MARSVTIEIPADLAKRLVERAKYEGEIMDDVAAQMIEEGLSRR